MSHRFRSRRNGSHYPLTRRRTLYGPPTYKKYSEILSDLHEPKDAEAASKEMLVEFNGAEERSKKVRVKRALVQRANRAEVASHNANLSRDTREKEARIARILNEAKDKMVIPPKE